ncbi:hypothetical protein [Rubricoccus marinus]|uniref:Right handed beta helix domain-containing protein n=1 Tax=Rubricoccus marinus TaxID=716817 RepID=A0A259TWW2_9BACT|nr:hypothetical protein [Rubricoccus marinus]OZC02211.1 hypothetical protein BSZ36_03935 [Rubricoccus marinus]
MRTRRLFLLLLAPLALLAAAPLALAAAAPITPEAYPGLPEADASTLLVLVADRGTPAYTAAESKANGSTIFVERKLWRGLEKAAELMNETDGLTVLVGIAGGEYTGQFSSGVWKVPKIESPNGTLKVLGGFNDDFSGRQPFGFPVRLTTVYGRDGDIFQMTDKSVLNELVVSGLVLDAAPSNAYDARTNSILKGQSRSYPLMSFGRATVNRLTVADNIFLNGAHAAVRLTITPASPEAEVHITNNFFLNNLLAFETQIYPSKLRTFGKLVVRHNSFVLNWPYNPDQTSSNVSAIELHTDQSFAAAAFERNLFAYNPGGVFQHDWPDGDSGELTIRENLFFLNGALWNQSAPEAAVVAGKFGTNPRYLVLDLYDVEDDLSATMSGNVAFDPQIPVVLAPLQSVQASGEVQAQPTVMNDVRRMFGGNTDGGTVAIANFAPQMQYDVRMVPLPRNEDAQPYGVQPAGLYGATPSTGERTAAPAPAGDEVREGPRRAVRRSVGGQ